MDEITQKISQFIDNDLDVQESILLLEQIKQQPELQQKLQRYQTMQSALETEKCLLIKPDNFLKGIQDGIKNEPTYLFPVQQKRKAKKPEYQTMAALAASIALFAVFITKIVENEPAQKINSMPTVKHQMMNLPISSTVAVNSKQETQSQNNAENSRYNDYLQGHNISLYTNGHANFRPYTQKAAYRQE